MERALAPRYKNRNLWKFGEGSQLAMVNVLCPVCRASCRCTILGKGISKQVFWFILAFFNNVVINPPLYVLPV